MLYDTLCNKLNPRSGTIQKSLLQDDKYWRTALDIAWKGDIHFIVVESLFRRSFGHYYVLRDNQYILPDVVYTKIDDALFKIMQSIIDDIESGKYANKKTLSEKIRLLVEQKGLVSYMNNTKWHELFNAINEKVPMIHFQYKSIFDEKAPDEYWQYYGDEDLPYMNLAQIEWLKIQHTITEYKHIGLLVPPKIQVHDKKDEIIQILEQYNIPYEYDKNEQVFVVYGYR